MSETVTETPIATPETPAEFLEGVADTTAAVVDAPADPEPEQPAPKPDKIERRVANLTRKMADADRARAAAEARAEAAEALLRAKDPDAHEEPSRRPVVDVEARAAQIVAEREFNRRLGEIDAAGKKEMGADVWQTTVDTMTSLGASQNTAFLQALAETDNPAKIFAELADDTDVLMELLGKSPSAMAARLGRMDAKLSAPAPTRPLSSAPAPAPKIKTAGVAPTPDIYDPNLSMADFNKLMDEKLSWKLGGKRK